MGIIRAGVQGARSGCVRGIDRWAEIQPEIDVWGGQGGVQELVTQAGVIEDGGGTGVCGGDENSQSCG